MNKKEKMKKIFITLLVFGIFFMLSGVFAQTELSEDLEDFVKKVAGRKGVGEGEITNVTKVDFNKLPEEVKIENIDDANIALYKIDSGSNESIFAITFSEDGFEGISAPQDYYTTSFLHFGMDKKTQSSTFLKTNTGIQGDLNKGYVMLRKGSITGISTNLEVAKSDTEGKIQIIILKNSEEIGFGNLIQASSTGIKKDYDIQSRDIIVFEPGDTISVYTKVSGKISWKDAITMIEISTLGN